MCHVWYLDFKNPDMLKYLYKHCCIILLVNILFSKESNVKAVKPQL